MQSIVDYFNEFLRVVFGSLNNGYEYLRLLSPSFVISELNTYVTSSLASSHPLESFFLNFIHYPSFLFSLIVWIWFSWLTIHLLLIWPFNWIRSVIRKCRI